MNAVFLCLVLGVVPGASFYAESGLEFALVKGASGADHEPHPLTLRPESLQRLPPPRDAGENAVLVGRDGRGAGQSWVLGGSPERVGVSLRALYLGGSSSSISFSCSVPQTVTSCKKKHLRIQSQGFCPRVSRCQPRRTEPGSRVRKKPDLT